MDRPNAKTPTGPRPLHSSSVSSVEAPKQGFKFPASRVSTSSFEPSPSGSTPGDWSRILEADEFGRDPLRAGIPPLNLGEAPKTHNTSRSVDDPFASYPIEDSKPTLSRSSSYAELDNTKYGEAAAGPYSSKDAPPSTASLMPPSEFGVRDDDEAFLTENMAQDDEDDESLNPSTPITSRKTIRYSTSPSPLRRTGTALKGVSQNLRRVSMRVVNTAAVGLENQVKDEASSDTHATLERAGSLKRTSLRGRALGILGPRNPVRVAFFNFLQYPWTEPMILVLIIINAIVLTIQSSRSFTADDLEPLLPVVGYFHTWEDWALLSLFILFTLEAIARICVSGFLLDPEMPISKLFASPFAETIDTPNVANNAYPVSPIDGPRGPLTRGLSLTERFRRLNSNLRRPFALGSDVEKRPTPRVAHDKQTKRRSHFREFSMTREDITLPPLLQRARTDDLLALPFKLNVTEAHTKIERNVPYLRHSWSRIDFVAIISFWITVVLASTGVERRPDVHIGIFRALSVLRVSRLLSITAGTTTIMHSLKRARHLLLNVLYFVVFAMILFSIIGVQSFKGSLRRSCWIGPTLGEPEIQTEQFCGGHVDPVTLQPAPYITVNGSISVSKPKGFICPLGQICKADENPNSGAESFDTIYNAALQVIITASANGWTPLMYSTIDAEFFVSSIFYIICVVVVNFWLMNLFVAVITSSFSAIRDETKKSAFGASVRQEDSEGLDDGWDDAQRKHTSTNWARTICEYTEWVWVLLALASLVLQATRSNTTPQDGIHNLLLHWGELAITLAFDLEIVLRFLATLPDWRSFFKEGRNWLDLVLAIACSIIQIPVIRGSSVYEWFTIFQLMRFYRVILVFPRMKPLLLSVFGNMVGLANMTLFMMLVNYLSALIAVQLLRGDLEGDQPINFGELYNAFLGVYQVFSSENWTDILYDSINAEAKYKQAAVVAIFWAVWEFFANFIMLQMFIAVINENFEVSEEAKESKQASHYWAMHEPAGERTPEWIKKLNPYRWLKAQKERPHQRDRREEHESYISRPFHRLSMRNPFSQSRQPRHYPSKSLSALQRLFAGGSSERDSYDVPMEPVGHKRMSTFASSSDPFDLDAEQNFELLESVKARDRALDLHTTAYNERLARKAKFIREHPTYDKTFWIFSQQNPLRRFCQRLVKPANGPRIFGKKTSPILEPIFQLVLLIAVIAGIGVESFATPLYRRSYYLQYGLVNWTWFDLCEWAFGLVLMAEFVIKIIADGVTFTPNAYILSIWNIFDFCVLAGLIVNLSTAAIFIGGLSRLTRSLKALRVLRLITLIGKMRETFESLIISGASRIMDAAILAILYMIPYAVWGLNIFHGKMNSCNDDGVNGLAECNGEFPTSAYGESFGYLVPRSWDNPAPSTKFSFDTFSSSLLILFETVSLEGWIDVMYIANSIRGQDLQPRLNVSQENAIFFLIYNLLGGVVILTLFVSIIISNFRNKTGSALLTQAQREWIDLQKLFTRQKPSKRPRVRPRTPVRAWCFDRAVQKHGWWSRSMTVIFVLHIIGLMTQTFSRQQVVDEFRNDFFLIVTCIYILDVVVRLYGLGIRSFCANGWNIFDVIVVTGSFVTTLAVRFGHADFVAEQLQKLFLVSIAFKLVQRNDSLNMLFKTAVASLPTIVSLLALWLILFIFFAIMYVEVFSLTKWGQEEDHNQNYSSVANALVMLAFMSAGEGWNGYMHDFAVVYPRCTNLAGILQESDCGSMEWAFSLFIAWNVLSMYIFVNLFTGVVVESFSYVFQRTRSGALAITREEMRSFKKLWAELSSPATGMLERTRLVHFLGRLSGPFEVRIYPREFDVHRLIKSCTDNNDSGDLVVDGMDIRKLNGMLKSLDPLEIRQRRLRYNRIYHEAMRHLREHGGIDFTKMLMLLAHHKLIVEKDALTMSEFVKRMEVTRDVKKLVYVDRVRSCLKTMGLRRRFLAYRAKQLEKDMPAIVVETPETPPTTTRDLGLYHPMQSPSPTHSPSLSVNFPAFSPPPIPPLALADSRTHRSQLSDVSMLSVDLGHNRSFSHSSSSDENHLPPSTHSSMWSELLENYQPPEGSSPPAQPR